MANLRPALACYCLLAALAVAPRAQAQLLDQFISPFIGGVANDPGVTVLSRQRNDYEAGGVRAGSFIVRPRLTESTGYESNVLGRRRASGSGLLETNAALSATSDVSRASLTGMAVVDDVKYFDLPNQSYTNWSARVGGSYDIGRDTVSVQLSHENLTQTLRDLDVPLLTVPLGFTIDTARVDYRAMFNRLSVTPSFEFSHYVYDSGLTGPSVFPQNYRNRVLFTPSLTLAYEFSPRRSAVLVLRNTNAVYANASQGLPRRNYDDYAALAGIDYDLSGLLRLRALVGYESRQFSSATYGTIEAPIAEATLIWTPTGLTTVTAGVARRIQDSAEETTAGVTATSARLRVDHEYLRNVLFAASAGVTKNDYRTGGNQVLYTAGAGATYLLNRNIGLTGTYDFIARTSSANTGLNWSGLALGSDYVDHRILLQLRLSL